MRTFLLVLAAAALAVLVLRLTVFAPEPVAVLVEEVAHGPVESSVANSKAGTVMARRRAMLSPGTSGIVIELFVERGDVVEQGAVLLRLEDDTQEAQLVQAERDLGVAVANREKVCLAADFARREYERNRQLAQEQLVSADLLDRLENAAAVADADCRVAQAEIARREAAVAVARAELSKTTLRAPFPAVIAEVDVELGEWVTPSVPLLAAPDVIDALDPASLYVAAPMDEVDSGSLAVGLPARVTVDSHPGRVFHGRIVRMAPYVLDVEQQNRTLEIEVELDEVARRQPAGAPNGGGPPLVLLPGTSADVEVILDVRDDVLRVPTFALLEGGRVLVFEGGTLVARDVVTGLRNWDWTEIVAGLAPGELVVTSLDRPGVRAGVAAVLEVPPGTAPAR